MLGLKNGKRIAGHLKQKSVGNSRGGNKNGIPSLKYVDLSHIEERGQHTSYNLKQRLREENEDLTELLGSIS